MSYPMWDEFVKTHNVHEETLVLTRTAIVNNVKPYHQMTLEEARITIDESSGGPSADDEAIVPQFITIPVNETCKPGPLAVYTPKQLKGDVPKIIAFCHGGGLVAGSIKGYHYMIEKLANMTGSIVVGVDYRLLPDAGSKYAPILDSMHAIQWIQANKEAVGGRVESKLGMAGDSAGGQLSLLVGLDNPGIDFLVLLYPATDLSTTTPSAVELMDIPTFCGKDLEWCQRRWKEAGISEDDPRIIPNARKDISSLPPTLMIVGTLDPMRDSILDFAKRLKDAGVKTQLSVYEGLPHGFLGTFQNFPTTAKRAFQEIGQFVESQ